jgi:hypothetical protein
MAKRSRLKQLQSLRLDIRAGVMLVRAFGPHLVRAFLDGIAARRRRRSLKIGAFAVGGAAAGLAAVRIATHRPPTGDDSA